jgi:hypothetical protein
MTSMQRLEDRLARVEAITQTPRQVLVVLGGNESPEQAERAKLTALAKSGLPTTSNHRLTFIRTGVHRPLEG